MSAIAKLMKARTEFHKRELKKSGWNDFSKFKYLEMADFLLPALEIFESLKLGAITSFTKELATMTIVDLEDNSQVVITSPFGSAALKACHEVQNIGAVETYQRRYLWVAALEIVEHDAIDASQGAINQEENQQKTPAQKPAAKQTAKPVNWLSKIEGAKNLDDLKAIFADAWKNTEGEAQAKCKSSYEVMKQRLTDEAMEAMQ